MIVEHCLKGKADLLAKRTKCVIFAAWWITSFLLLFLQSPVGMGPAEHLRIREKDSPLEARILDTQPKQEKMNSPFTPASLDRTFFTLGR